MELLTLETNFFAVFLFLRIRPPPRPNLFPSTPSSVLYVLARGDVTVHACTFHANPVCFEADAITSVLDV